MSSMSSRVCHRDPICVVGFATVQAEPTTSRSAITHHDLYSRLGSFCEGHIRLDTSLVLLFAAESPWSISHELDDDDDDEDDDENEDKDEKNEEKRTKTKKEMVNEKRERGGREGGNREVEVEEEKEEEDEEEEGEETKKEFRVLALTLAVSAEERLV
ncbi:hypothetical protein M0802_003498 [Mischocyttarus mexicanus]|nr:hypothetical protein M0802_003498 [Mischocyttarus mexicanus]